jgi:hypothetical protein
MDASSSSITQSAVSWRVIVTTNMWTKSCSEYCLNEVNEMAKTDQCCGLSRWTSLKLCPRTMVNPDILSWLHAKKKKRLHLSCKQSTVNFKVLTAASMNSNSFSYMTPCSLVVPHLQGPWVSDPEDGSNIFLRNVGVLLSDHTTSHSKIKM